jgi:hypothetical protein
MPAEKARAVGLKRHICEKLAYFADDPDFLRTHENDASMYLGD